MKTALSKEPKGKKRLRLMLKIWRNEITSNLDKEQSRVSPPRFNPRSFLKRGAKSHVWWQLSEQKLPVNKVSLIILQLNIPLLSLCVYPPLTVQAAAGKQETRAHSFSAIIQILQKPPKYHLFNSISSKPATYLSPSCPNRRSMSLFVQAPLSVPAIHCGNTVKYM